MLVGCRGEKDWASIRPWTERHDSNVVQGFFLSLEESGCEVGDIRSISCCQHIAGPDAVRDEDEDVRPDHVSC